MEMFRMALHMVPTFSDSHLKLYRGDTHRPFGGIPIVIFFGYCFQFGPVRQTGLLLLEPRDSDIQRPERAANHVAEFKRSDGRRQKSTNCTWWDCPMTIHHVIMQCGRILSNWIRTEKRLAIGLRKFYEPIRLEIEMSHRVPGFRFFGSLPYEIRAEIWHHARRGRLLHLKFMHERKFLTLAPRKGTPFIPAVLHACQESRELSLKHYKILVLCPGIESRVFVDFKIDTVFFSDRLHRRGSINAVWDAFDTPLLLGNWDTDRGTNVCLVENVAFDFEFFDTVTKSSAIPRAFICNFTGLRSITWVVRRLLERKVVIDGWKMRAEALLEGNLDEFGFEEVRDENVLTELYKTRGTRTTIKRWLEWDLTEWKDFSHFHQHEDELDPRFERLVGHGVTGGNWRRVGRIRDARLMSKAGFWDKTNMRVAVDHDVFPLVDEVRKRLELKRALENERKRKIRTRGLVMIHRTVDRDVEPEVERALDKADKELYVENDSEIEEDLRGRYFQARIKAQSHT